MNASELIDALREARTPKEGGPGLRVEEIRAATGWAEHTIRAWLRQELARGTVRRTQRFLRRIDGRVTVVSGYEWVA